MVGVTTGSPPWWGCTLTVTPAGAMWRKCCWNSSEISELFQNHFRSIAPAGVTVDVLPHHGGEPVVTPTNSVAYRAAADAMETTFGKRPVPTRGGGSIPIVAMFKSELGLDTVLLGFGLDSDAIHSPNEHFGVFNFLKGIETIPHFYRNYAAAR